MKLHYIIMLAITIFNAKITATIFSIKNIYSRTIYIALGNKEKPAIQSVIKHLDPGQTFATQIDLTREPEFLVAPYYPVPGDKVWIYTIKNSSRKSINPDIHVSFTQLAYAPSPSKEMSVNIFQKIGRYLQNELRKEQSKATSLFGYSAIDQKIDEILPRVRKYAQSALQKEQRIAAAAMGEPESGPISIEKNINLGVYEPQITLNRDLTGTLRNNITYDQLILNEVLYPKCDDTCNAYKILTHIHGLNYQLNKDSSPYDILGIKEGTKEANLISKQYETLKDAIAEIYQADFSQDGIALQAIVDTAYGKIKK